MISQQWVGSIDLAENPEANANIVLQTSVDLIEQENELLSKIGSVLSDQKVDAVLCVAGGWAGGNSSNKGAKIAKNFFRRVVFIYVQKIVISN